VQTASTYYNFSNIRYAAPPIGDLRFAAPTPPLYNRSAGIQDGQYRCDCPQIFPRWFNRSSPNTAVDEDCLFLDVLVPPQIFRRNKSNASMPAPVLVWFHGGGYVTGSKNGDPTAFLDQIGSRVVSVSFNYRVS
jgi:carboxylesterase type B